MQTIEINNTVELRRALTIAISAIATLDDQLEALHLHEQFNGARLELQLIHAALLVAHAQAEKRAAGSGTRAS